MADIHTMRGLLLIFCFNFYIIFQGVAQNKIELKSVEEVLSVGKQVSFLEDKNGNLSLEDALKPQNQQKFQAIDDDIFIKPATTSAYWFKVTVRNFSNEDAWLSIGRSESLYIDFYSPDSVGNYQKPIKTGAFRPFKSRPYRIISDFWLPLNLAKDTQPRTYYVRIKQLVSYELPFRVGTLRSLNHRKDVIDGINMAFLGIMLIMMLYNSFLFFTTKENIYVLYEGWA